MAGPELSEQLLHVPPFNLQLMLSSLRHIHNPVNLLFSFL